MVAPVRSRRSTAPLTPAVPGGWTQALDRAVRSLLVAFGLLNVAIGAIVGLRLTDAAARIGLLLAMVGGLACVVLTVRRRPPIVLVTAACAVILAGLLRGATGDGGALRELWWPEHSVVAFICVAWADRRRPVVAGALALAAVNGTLRACADTTTADLLPVQAGLVDVLRHVAILTAGLLAIRGALNAAGWADRALAWERTSKRLVALNADFLPDILGPAVAGVLAVVGRRALERCAYLVAAAEESIARHATDLVAIDEFRSRLARRLERRLPELLDLLDEIAAHPERLESSDFRRRVGALATRIRGNLVDHAELTAAPRQLSDAGWHVRCRSTDVPPALDAYAAGLLASLELTPPARLDLTIARVTGAAAHRRVPISGGKRRRRPVASGAGHRLAGRRWSGRDLARARMERPGRRRPVAHVVGLRGRRCWGQPPRGGRARSRDALRVSPLPTPRTGAPWPPAAPGAPRRASRPRVPPSESPPVG
ncbi:hypothetical protein [Nostocoides veronense]|uniref:hypothetical protein n=1 Tax=Nostocoides veronense TaxID=330836 RepID=UPI0031CF90A4